jgi:hypothetical protein
MLSAGHMRRRWAGIIAVLIVCISVAGILAALGSHMKRREAVLDERGRRTEAVVVSVDDRYRRADTATLRFDHEGREYDAETTVGDIDDFPVGSVREVIYDPAHPSHARPVKGWSPTYDSFFITAFMLLVAGVTHSARRSVSTVLAKRVEGQTVLRVETFQMRRCGSDGPGSGPGSGRSTPIQPARTPPSTSRSRTSTRSTPSGSRSRRPCWGSRHPVGL